MTTSMFKIESGIQLLARLSKRQEIENFYPILFEQGLKHSDVVEIISNNNYCYLLIDIICEALIPTAENKEALGVLMFSTAGHFSFHELIRTIQKRIDSKWTCKLDNQIKKAEMDRLLQTILSNFFLLEVYDATQMYTTIHNLDNILSNHSNISLLLFDTLTSFYWSEQAFKIIKMDMFIKNLLGIIEKVTKEYKLILFYTRPAYFSSSKDIDLLETSEITNGVNFRVQLLHDAKRAYEVNVKTMNSYYKKYFHILDNKIEWQ